MRPPSSMCSAPARFASCRLLRFVVLANRQGGFAGFELKHLRLAKRSRDGARYLLDGPRKRLPRHRPDPGHGNKIANGAGIENQCPMSGQASDNIVATWAATQKVIRFRVCRAPVDMVHLEFSIHRPPADLALAVGPFDRRPALAVKVGAVPSRRPPAARVIRRPLGGEAFLAVRTQLVFMRLRRRGLRCTNGPAVRVPLVFERLHGKGTPTPLAMPLAKVTYCR